MRTFKNNLKRNRNRGSQDRSFKRSIDISRLNTDFGNRDNGFRRKNNINNGKYFSEEITEKIANNILKDL